MRLFECRGNTKAQRQLRSAIMMACLCCLLQAASAGAETTIIPSATASGRFDSNVFYAPPGFLQAGVEKEDFVSSVGAAAELMHQTRDVEAHLKVGGDFNVFARNTPLNFFNMNVKGQVLLDRWVDQFVRGARLSIHESFVYTPETPGFATGVRTTALEDPFLRGLTGFRANTFANSTSVHGSYPFSRDLSIEGDYTFSIRRTGSVRSINAEGTPRFFNSVVNSWSFGPRYQLTRNDSIALIYRHSFILQSATNGGRTFDTNILNLVGEYRKEFSELTLTVDGGVAVMQPVNRTIPTVAIKIRSNPERATVVDVSLSRVPRPSFFLVGGAMISNVARAGITHQLSGRLTAEGNAALAYNQFTPDTGATFRTISASTSLRYNLTREISANVLYAFTTTNADALTIQYEISRHQVGLFLAAEWK